MSLSVEERYADHLGRMRAGATEYGRPFTSSECREYLPTLKDKVIIITGGGSGLGKGFAQIAAKHGAKIVIGDVNMKGANAAVQEIKRAGGKAVARECNVTSWESQRDLFKAADKEFGSIDIVAPFAGVTEKFYPGYEDDILDKSGELDKPVTLTLDINLTGVIYSTKLAYYYLRKRPDRKGRTLLLMGSMASWVAIPSGPMYATSKHAVRGLSQSAYFTMYAHGIRTAMIAPWFTDTGIIEPLTRMGLIGLPFAKMEDTLDAVCVGACHPESDGMSLVVDPKGVFGIPFESRTMAKGSIYQDFGDRAVQLLSIKAGIVDIYKLIRIKFGAKAMGLPLLLALAAVFLRRRRNAARLS